MHVLLTGAAGMIGQKLVEQLVRDGTIGGEEGSRVSLVDVVEPEARADAPFGVDAVAADLADEGVAAGLVADRPDVIFHLAAVVSGEAERDFEKGYRANLDGMRLLLDAVRELGGGHRPRFV